MSPISIGHSLKTKEAGLTAIWDNIKISVVDKRPHNVDESSRNRDLPKTPKVGTSKMDHRSRWGCTVLRRPTYNTINLTWEESSDGSQDLSLLPWSVEVPPREKDVGRNDLKKESSNRLHVLELPCCSVER